MATDDEMAIGLRIDPVDTLFFRDGRPFDPASRGQSGLPNSQTLAGALRTALLHTWLMEEPGRRDAYRRELARQQFRVPETLKALAAPAWTTAPRFRGPWLAFDRVDDPGGVDPLLPTPVTLARAAAGVAREGPRARGEWFRGDPLRQLPGWPEDPPPDWPGRDKPMPVWRRDRGTAKPPGGFVAPAGIRAFLAGGVPDDTHWYRPADLYGFDHRTGIGIRRHELSTAEGLIYAVSLLALRGKHCPAPEGALCLYAEILADAGLREAVAQAVAGPLRLGGEGRYAHCTIVPPYDWSALQPAPRPGRTCWLLASPGFFEHNAPDGPRCSAFPRMPGLCAAATGNAVAVSGWDVAANQPRRTRFGVPAGSVYFATADETRTTQSLCTNDDGLSADGWGFALRGVWDYA